MNKMRITLLLLSFFCYTTIFFAAEISKWKQSLENIKNDDNWDLKKNVPTKKWMDEIIDAAVEEIKGNPQKGKQLSQELSNKLKSIGNVNRIPIRENFEQKLKEKIHPNIVKQEEIFQDLLKNIEVNWLTSVPTDNWKNRVVEEGKKLIQLNFNINNNDIVEKVVNQINGAIETKRNFLNSAWINTTKYNIESDFTNDIRLAKRQQEQIKAALKEKEQEEAKLKLETKQRKPDELVKKQKMNVLNELKIKHQKKEEQAELEIKQKKEREVAEILERLQEEKALDQLKRQKQAVLEELKTESLLKKTNQQNLQQKIEKQTKLNILNELMEKAREKETTRQEIIKKDIAKRKQKGIAESANEARKRRLQSAIRYDRYKKNIENLRRQIKEIEQGPPG